MNRPSKPSGWETFDPFFSGILPVVEEENFSKSFLEEAPLRSYHSLEVVDPFTGDINTSYLRDEIFSTIQKDLIEPYNIQALKRSRKVGSKPTKVNMYTEWGILDNKDINKPIEVYQRKVLARSSSNFWRSPEIFIYEGSNTALLNRLFILKSFTNSKYNLMEDLDTGELVSIPRYNLAKPIGILVSEV